MVPQWGWQGETIFPCSQTPIPAVFTWPHPSPGPAELQGSQQGLTGGPLRQATPKANARAERKPSEPVTLSEIAPQM